MSARTEHVANTQKRHARLGKHRVNITEAITRHIKTRNLHNIRTAPRDALT
jgi:hypothetical protein